MDTPQLKVLAGHVRKLLEQAHHSVTHSQSLDLIAALPGLRNWPEVQAFPDRVAACELDNSSAARLTHRLKRTFHLELEPHEVLKALNPLREAPGTTHAPQIWPTGPAPGVYVTTSQSAIDALVATYEAETDGALLYAERAASSAEGAIDLGDAGLWSSGLDRVPSGTLIVVGPIALAQDEWEGSVDRLRMACIHADYPGHRVALLVSTPRPEDLCEDIFLMARTAAATDGVDYKVALRGMVADDGELTHLSPFAKPWPRIEAVPTRASPEAIPSVARTHLRRAIETKGTGFLVFGSDSVEGHWAADLVNAALSLTDASGPAARIIPRIRSTPSKDWLVPEATRQLPFLPSIASAYDRGYRRMVIDPHYLDGDILRERSRDVLFLAGTHGYEASHILFSLLRAVGSTSHEVEILTQIIGLVGVARVPTKTGTHAAVDLFLGPDSFPADAADLRDIAEFVSTNRTLKWEDQVLRLVEGGVVTHEELRAADLKPAMLARHLKVWSENLTDVSSRNS